ncbi:MAG: preprotein translocase subunit Sec61beta [Promethearchaeota archaeon]
MRFFEDSSIGIKVSPITTVILALALIVIVYLAWLEIFNWLFTLS